MRRAFSTLIALGVIVAGATAFAQSVPQSAIAPASSNFIPVPADAFDVQGPGRTLEEYLSQDRPVSTYRSKYGSSNAGSFGAPLGPPTPVVCPGSGINEVETCGSMEMNAGCSSGFCSVNFETALPGEIRCGTASAENGTRDIDSYSITFTAPNVLEVTFASEFPGVVEIAEIPSGDCTSFFSLAEDFSANGNPVTLSRVTTGGTYLITVTTEDANGPIFDGIPCGADNDYTLEINAMPVADCGFAAATELEACGAFTNDGCNAMMMLEAEPISSGDTVIGTVTDAGFGPAADLDQYSFTIASPQEITVELTSQFSANFFILDTDCVGVGGQVFRSPILTAPGDCATETLTVNLDPGDYTVSLQPGDEFGFTSGAIPCGQGNGYEFTFNIGPVAAGCTVTIPGGAIPESTLNCGDPDTNDGCNGPGTQFDALTIGETRSGEMFAENNLRDLDWYQFSLGQAGTVEWTLTSEIPASAVITTPVCGGLGVFGFVSSDNCTPDTLSVNLAPGDYFMLVLPDDGTLGGIFNGFSCATGNNSYVLETSLVTGGVCLPPTAGLLTGDCASGDLIINDLTAGSDYDSIDFVVTDPSGGTTNGTIAGPITSGSMVTQTLGTFTDPGLYTVDFTANCSAGGTEEFTLVDGIFPYNGETDVIFDSEIAGAGGGCIDSAGALAAELSSQMGVSLLTVVGTVDDYDCLASIPQGTNIYIIKGTFPNNTPISGAEGDAIAGLIQTGLNVYLEAPDGWGFDLDNSSRDFDGVAGRFGDGNLILDVDDTCDEVTGFDGAGQLDLTGLGTIAYNQDNQNPNQFGGDDFTDQLDISGAAGASGEDLPAGSTAGVALRNSINNVGELDYAVMIAYGPSDPLFGRVVSSSVEIGGLPTNTVAAAILGFFNGGTMGGENFNRGDVNGD